MIISLVDNNLVGTLNTQLFANNANLIELDMEANHFYGSLNPQLFTNNVMLRVLNLGVWMIIDSVEVSILSFSRIM